MSSSRLQVTYIGGPTALLELGGLRLLTDPTFDPAGSEYRTPIYVLRKTQGPALAPEAVGAVDVVLLSHDHHFDNLDGDNTIGLAPWQSHDLPTRDGRMIRITATPARHGPPDGDRGPVVGFVLAFTDQPARVVYVSGDTVWYDGIAEVSRRFTPGVAMLFMGAARVREVGPANLTFTAGEAVAAARAFPEALIVPLHFEGWTHFSESRAEIDRAFAAAGLADRLRWPIAGQAMELSGT